MNIKYWRNEAATTMSIDGESFNREVGVEGAVPRIISMSSKHHETPRETTASLPPYLS